MTPASESNNKWNRVKAGREKARFQIGYDLERERERERERETTYQDFGTFWSSKRIPATPASLYPLRVLWTFMAFP